MGENDDEESGIIGKLAASAVIIVLAIPGLIIEPGPLSELVALGLLAAIWTGGEDPGEALRDASDLDTGE